MSLGSHGVDRVLSLRKIPTRLCGTNFCSSSECFASSFVRQPNGHKCTKSTSSARFALSFVRQPNGPKWIQMVRNAPKHEFRVPWGGSGAFVAENSDASSWHEFLQLFGTFCPEFRKATKWSQKHLNGTKRTKT